MDLIKFVENFERKLEKKNISFLPTDFVHGYLTGICIAPSLITPNEWIAVLLEDKVEFEDKNDAEFVLSFLFELHNRITDKIHNEEIFPLLPEVEDENGVHLVARDWCRGFLFATTLYRDEFFQYMKKNDDNLIDVLILNYLAEVGEIGELVLQKMITDWKNAKLELIDSIPDIVLFMYDYFQKNYYNENYYEGEFDDEVERIKPIKKAAPKVGRNDPCPCGSGKKYKKCCGKGK